MINSTDFDYVQKVTFPPKGSTEAQNITPAHDLAQTFKFKTYAPKVFAKLREYFEISKEDYMNSVCGED